MLNNTFSALQRCHWQCGSIFISLAVVASHICEILRNSLKIRTYSSSRSSRVIDLDANRKRICSFLLVINSNFGHISYCFWDIDKLWHKGGETSYSLFPPPLFDVLRYQSKHRWKVRLQFCRWQHWSTVWVKKKSPLRFSEIFSQTVGNF